MLVAVENEPIVKTGWGRWEYVRDTKTGWRGYLHLDCDVVEDQDGYCIMCGAPCPTIQSSVEGGMR